ncbi:unnamed protein product [Prorocentrum cordatum]|uniref:Ubiquitinyl hydrolase 1 n=1 Tax=Prorocentrum cordatum TaxID=2364126 RepID=A0ABN9X8U9_9DINO|nr:unnamed protein product [Polarella glacialis]
MPPAPRRQSSKLPGGGVDAEAQDHRLSLETFSMWLLKRGIRLRACPHLAVGGGGLPGGSPGRVEAGRRSEQLRDEKIGVADFLQGAGGLCCSLALFRLLDLEKRQQGIDTRDLEAILADARVSLGGPDLALPIAQVARQATDFEFFRSFLLPRLQGAAAFRLRVFAELPPQES